MTTPSEVRQPPSKSAVTFLRVTDGNENGRRLSPVTAARLARYGQRIGFDI